MTGVVRLGGSGLAIADIAAIARHCAIVEPAPGVTARLKHAREILEKAAVGGQQIYGMNTALGANFRTSVSEDDHDFQRRLVMGRGMAVGLVLSVAETRAVIGARLAMLAVGGSGISVETFMALIAMLNAGVHPEMPSIGSIGAGDLVQMSAMAQCLIGEGRAEFRGESMTGLEALARAGLAPLELQAKDGISLLNASAVSAGCGALALLDLQRLLDWQREAVALSFEALGGNPLILMPAIQAARPAPHQAEEAASILAKLEGSSLFSGGMALQDPLSLRCVAPVHGALADALEKAVSIVEIELNAAADNPLVIVSEERVLSTGNFHTPALSLAMESLGLAVAQAAAAAAARFIQTTGSGRNGLPRYLSPVGGASAGFVPMQKTVAALMARVRHLANPVMLDFLPVSEGVEDHATQSTLTVEKLRSMIELWKKLIACELLAAAQAVDLRSEHRCGVGTSQSHDFVRGHADFAAHDQPLTLHIERLAAAM